MKFVAVLRVGIIAATASAQLASCATRPSSAVLQPVSAVGGGQKLTVLAATNRSKDAKDIGFGSGRGRTVKYERYVMSIPPSHKPPEIEWPKGKPDAKRDFVVTDSRVLDQKEFLAEAAKPSSDGSVGLFVHGYNYNYQESLYRLAQIATDAKSNATPVLFSWPSEGALTGYVADKDAALYSRDDLVSLVTSLSSGRGVKRVVLFGHSMGGFLIMEALRELKLNGRDDVLGKLSVVLAAPDIDADVFRRQLDVIGPMATPLTLFVSKDNKALAVSSFLGGDRQRAGRLDVDDPIVKEAAVKYKLRVIDITQLKGPDSLGHDRYASLAALGPQLANVDRRNGLAGMDAGAFVFDAAANIVSSPFRLAGSVIGAR